MSANAIDTTRTASAENTMPAPVDPTEMQPDVPLQITNAQTVCNRKNEKGKLCNGHLKQLRTGGEEAEKHLRGDDVLFKCQSCGTLYMGPPLGHVRDPDKQKRFVEQELAAILQAAGGTLPAFKMSDRGTLVPVDEPVAHSATTPAKPASTAAAKPATAAAVEGETPEEKKARLIAEAAARKAATGDVASAPAEAAATKSAAPKASAPKVSLGPIPGASGPVPGETPEQKIARLKAVVAEAKRRKEALESGGDNADETTRAAPDAIRDKPAARTTPAASSTSGTDSSPSADAHRPAAEAQAATGVASAAPLSPAAATASPVAGAEEVAELAPDSLQDASAAATPAPKPASASRTASTPIPGASGPVPGETHEQKIARLKAVVAEAKRRAELEGRGK